MYYLKCTSIFLWVFLVIGCSDSSIDPITANSDTEFILPPAVNSATASEGGYNIPWGVYKFEIARDGSYADVIPNRTVNWRWGIHLNAVKFLETDPCTNCIGLSNVHMLPDGDVSVDVSITHPFKNPMFTGFDVRGVIMFPASQYLPDNELRELAGSEPWNGDWHHRWSTHLKGDAELMNSDGYTSAFSPEENDTLWWLNDIWQKMDDLPIFGYYHGKFASGENLGNINGYKHYWSNENRHMFEVNKTVTRTYIIRPPAIGPIEASYVVYAHWFEPDVLPVTNPVSDFPPQANSPLPYEFWITQDEPIDPDKDGYEQSQHIHWHIKTWSKGVEDWLGDQHDVTYEYPWGGSLYPHPSGEPDDYWLKDFEERPYSLIPGGLPGSWPYLYRVAVKGDVKPHWVPIGLEYYIAWIDIAASDGE